MNDQGTLFCLQQALLGIFPHIRDSYPVQMTHILTCQSTGSETHMLGSVPQEEDGTRGQDMRLGSHGAKRRTSSLEAVSSVCTVNILVSDMVNYYFEVHLRSG